MKNLLAVLALTFVCFSVSAQIRVAPKVGLNLANRSFEVDGLKGRENAIVSFHAGVIAEYYLTDFLSLEPGVLFSQKGHREEVYDGGNYYEDKYQINYLEIPLNLKFNFGNFYINAGPYYALAVSGKRKINGGKADLFIGNGANDDVQKSDLGMNLGVGVNISRTQIGVNYGFGLKNINPEGNTSGDKSKNSVFNVSLAIFIND